MFVLKKKDNKSLDLSLQLSVMKKTDLHDKVNAYSEK